MTELQDRLEHLVNYSSQLIFVSGDTIAQQQRSLDDFLSIQQENTEISYINAQEGFEASDYRRQICRQLLGQVVGSYVRPIKELLKSLNDHEGPFLVCIKQAELMPDEFLQELWDWIIHSRKQQTQQHLNIILFAQSQWAEQAKQWLPNKNSDKPVLLSSESLHPSGIDEKALQDLMAEQRGEYKKPFTRSISRTNLLTKKWFISVILLSFFIIFIALMSWQYPQHVQSLLTDGTLPAELSKVRQETDEANPTANDELVQAYKENIPNTGKLEILDEDPFVANDILVKQWSEEQVNNNEVKHDLAPDTIDVLDDSSKANLNSSAIEEVAATQGDFAVPDILSVEQLDATLGEALLASESKSQSNPTQTQTGVEQASSSNTFRFDESIILTLNDSSVLLQLSGMQNPNVLNTYIESNRLSQNTWIYETTRYGGPWFVVLLNRSFDNLSEAQNAIASLQENIRQSQPFAKSASQIKQEIQNR